MKNSDALLMQLRARDGFISFAVAKAKPGTKNCVKGWICGNTCLSRTKKNCKKALEDSRKTFNSGLKGKMRPRQRARLRLRPKRLRSPVVVGREN